MINILTKDCDFEISNLYYKKRHDTVVNKYCTYKDQTQVYLFSGNQELYLLHRNWEPNLKEPT